MGLLSTVGQAAMTVAKILNSAWNVLKGIMRTMGSVTNAIRDAWNAFHTITVLNVIMALWRCMGIARNATSLVWSVPRMILRFVHLAGKD